ncbi:hypothetical protein JCM3774_000855 [Rhodotorula dairenensis]
MSSRDQIPDEAPPAYTPTDHLQVPSAAAVSSAGAESANTRHRRTSSAGSTASSNYTTDDDHYEESGDGIPEEVRRDMLDESRPLPDGWRREFDANSGHYFYVDTKAKPPRSIWSHPLDPEYLRAHPDVAEKVVPPAEKPDSDQDRHHKLHKSASSHASTSGSTSASGSGSHGQEEDNRTFGRKMKDKLTGTTHEQRVEQRRKQAEQEKKEYEAYLRRRAQIRQAQAEGRYRPMYGAPMGPYVRTVPLGYGGGMYGRSGLYGGGMYGGGMYGRPYYGSGIGMGTRSGMGTGMALGGGMLGGLLLGDMLF